MNDNMHCYVDRTKLSEFLYLHYANVYENRMTYQSDIFDDNHMIQLHDDILLELLDKNNLLLKREKSMNSDNELPIIIKAILLGNDDTIYLTDEYNTSRRDRVTLPGGHLRVDKSYTRDSILLQLYRKMWEEMTIDGITGWEMNQDLLRADISSGLYRGIREFMIQKVSPYTFCKYDECSGLYLFIPLKIHLTTTLPTDLRVIIPMDKFDYDILKRKYESMDIIHPTREDKDRLKRIISGNEFSKEDDVRYPIHLIQVLTPIFNDIHKLRGIFND